MKYVLSTVLLVILINCDFERPDDNELFDLNRAINFFDMNQLNTQIFDFPSNNDLTETVEWNIADDRFQMLVSTEILVQGEFSFFSHPTRDVYLETKKHLSFIGVDSIAPVTNIELINSNSHYDVNDRLEIVSQQLQFRVEGEDVYRPVVNVEALKDLDVNVQLRLFLRITSGYTYNFEFPQANFYPNQANYKISYELLCFYF